MLVRILANVARDSHDLIKFTDVQGNTLAIKPPSLAMPLAYDVLEQPLRLEHRSKYSDPPGCIYKDGQEV